MEVPGDLAEAVTSRLPIEGDGFRVELVRFTGFSWGTGIRGVLRTTWTGGAVTEAEVALLESRHLGDVAWDTVVEALDAWCARVTAMTRAEAERADLAPWAEIAPDELERRYAAWRKADPAADEARRGAALIEARAAFPRLVEHVRAVWGLVLPETLAVYHAFHLALRDLPGAVRDASDTRPGGILDRLAPGGWDRRLIEGLDERVHVRFRADPPEMLTFAWGSSDGQHFGLWYDDAERVGPVVHNYARDSAETWSVGDHPLAVCRHRWRYNPPPDDETSFPARWFLEELAWFEDQEATVAGPVMDIWARASLLAGPGSDPEVPLPLDVYGRDDAYRNAPDTVRGWLAEARTELVAGRPGMALALGRELHWLDSDVFRAEAGELLVEAYEELGRSALAGIARAHLRLRDLPSVEVLR